MESQHGLCKRPASEDACSQPSSKQQKHAPEDLPQASTSAREAAAATQLSFPILSGPQLSLAWGRTPGRTSSEPLLAGTPTHSAASEAPSLSNWARKSPPMGSPTSSLACSLQQWARCAPQEGQPQAAGCDRCAGPSGSAGLPPPSACDEDPLVPPPLLHHLHQQEEEVEEEGAHHAAGDDEDTADTATSSSSEGDSMGHSSGSRHVARRVQRQRQQQRPQEPGALGAAAEEEVEDDHSINSSRPVTAGSPAFTFVAPTAAAGSVSHQDQAAASAADAVEGPQGCQPAGPQVEGCPDDDAAVAPAAGELWLFCGQTWEGSALEVRGC